MNKEILNPQPTEANPVIVENYPYGFKKTKIKYWVESVKKRGDRFVSQTLNPKTQKWNKPKKATYNAVVILYKNEKGYIKGYHYHRSTGKEEYNKFMEFIGDTKLNDLQKEELRILRAYIKTYEGVRFECRSREGSSFLNDGEKMKDFKELSKEEFLKSYSYLTEEDYKETQEDIKQEEIKKTINKSIVVNYHNDEGNL